MRCKNLVEAQNFLRLYLFWLTKWVQMLVLFAGVTCKVFV